MQESYPGIEPRVRVSIWAFQRLHGEPASGGGRGGSVCVRRMSGRGALWAGKWLAMLALAVVAPLLNAQETTAAQGAGAAPQLPDPPPRVVEAARFLAQRGWTPGRAAAGRLRRHAS